MRTPVETRGVANLNDELVSIKGKDYSKQGARIEVPIWKMPSTLTRFKLFLLTPGLGAIGSVRWTTANDDTATLGIRFENVDYSNQILNEL